MEVKGHDFTVYPGTPSQQAPDRDVVDVISSAKHGRHSFHPGPEISQLFVFFGAHFAAADVKLSLVLGKA